MNERPFEFPKIESEYPLYAFEIELFQVKEIESPVEWARAHFKLSSAYAHPGDFVPYPWQVEPINAIEKYSTVIICASTQLFKSLCAEIQVAWCIDNMPMNAILCYAKRETVEDVFDDRIKPLIKEVPAIRKYWSGDEKELTRKKIKLAHMFMRVASAEVPSDIATWGSGLVYADEVSKYRKRRGFDPIEALKRRQEAYRILGRHKTIIVSSPLFDGDVLHEEMNREGVLRLQPYVPCPNCGQYQVLVDSQIREIPNQTGEKDHNPDRILEEKAAFYECLHCKKPISEENRIKMGENVVYAAKNEEIGKNGIIKGRKNYHSVSFQINRLVDFSFSFSECLARFYAARKKGAESLQVYVNEDMARFWHTDTIQISEDYLYTRCSGYRQFSEGDIPNDVLILIAGIDTQDAGFYFVVNGYGQGMKQYLVRSGFVDSPKGLSEGGKDPRQVAYERLRAAIWSGQFKRRDGRLLSLQRGFIDRGGHRAEDVDYICEHIMEIEPYIGSVRPDFTKPLVFPSGTGNHYMGQTSRISQEVTRIISSKQYFLPDDIQKEYIDQVRNEYMETVIDKMGNTKLKFVQVNPNHYRSCENYAFAATELERLRQYLFDSSTVEQLSRNIQNQDQPQKKVEPNNIGRSNYFEGLRRW